MDESAVRDLLDRLVAEEPPASSVSIPMARRSGRRRVRLRRVYLPTAAAPVAAAVAVGLIASLSVGVHGGHLARHVSAPGHLVNAPARFDPLVPYAKFGWLPKGYSITGQANQTLQTSAEMGLTASSRRGGQLQVNVYPAGQCRLGGPVVIKTRRVPGARAAWTAAKRKMMKDFHVRTHYPHSLNCRGGVGGALLTGRAPDVNGQPAYWDIGHGSANLAWEYGHRAWAVLNYQPAIYFESPSHTPSAAAGKPRKLLPPPSASSLATMRKVASRMRYGAPSTVFYGFTISRLPGAWRAGRVGSPVNFPFYSVALLDGREANDAWTAGPAADPSALLISILPSAGSYACNFVAGQSQYVTLDGARAVLRTIDYPYKHVQTLCARDVRGMQLDLSLDLSIPTTKDTPLPDAHAVGNLLNVFSHLRLLGQNLARWVTSPVG
jgi:hypothetical protein